MKGGKKKKSRSHYIIGVRFDKKTAEELMAKAKLMDLTVSFLVRVAVKQKLTQWQKQGAIILGGKR